MPGSGSGTMTPVSPPGGGVPSVVLSVPLPLTILSINQFAKIMGINPAHFWQATAISTVPSRMPVDSCGSIYHQYPWQDSDKISRYDIAIEIAKAESDIANALGYWPGPWWIQEEQHEYIKHHRRDLFGGGGDSRYLYKAMPIKWGKLIQMGKRKATLIGTPTTAALGLQYTDQDGDGFFETATISIATTATDIRDLHVFHSGFSGQPEFEIREPRKSYISAGVAYFIYDAWLFINPELYEEPSKDDESIIDITTTANYVTAVDVYQITADVADESVMFYWGNQNVGCATCGGAGCEACGYISQEGCAWIRDAENGVVSPVPASYTIADGWTEELWTGDREPDRLKLWYQSGLISEAYMAGRTTNPLDPSMALVIAHLATSRLERPLCGCANIQSLADRLRRDTTAQEGEQGMFFSSVGTVENPFGTRVGEVEAWKSITKSRPHRISVAVI